MSMNEIRIGQYRFSKNLGNGSFGKVKSKYFYLICNNIYIVDLLN